MPSTDSKLRLRGWLAALFLVIVGAKLWVIQVYGSPLPFWDQWDEAKLLFKPWLEGHLTWSALFAPHNEHRILFTRLLDLFVLQLNRQWDPRLQMVVNALIHAGYACGLAYCLWIFTGQKRASLICFLLAPFFALPFAAENTIHGFQSQEYFLNIFSVITIVGLGLGSPGSSRWFLGLAAAIMSLFTMASGLLAALAVAGLVGLRMLKQKSIARSHLITLGCSLAVFILGLFLRVTVEENKQFQAQSLLAFLHALASNLAWPFRYQPVMCGFICLPLVITGIRYFRPGFKEPWAAEFVLAIGLWGLIQAVALAYGRAATGGSSRYMDTLATIPIASLAGLFVIGQGMEFRRVPRQLALLLAIVWVGTCFGGMWRICRTTLGDYRTMANYLQWSKLLSLIEEGNVRAFVATDDSRYLLNQPLWHVPYWDGGRLIGLLRDPKLSAILPPVCRAPLKLEPVEDFDASYIPDGYPPERPKQEFARVWGSYNTNGAAAIGHFVSKRIFATLPVLNIQLCCGPDMNDIRLQLVEQPTNRKIALSPKVVWRWHTITVATPQSPFRVEITDQSRDSWVAVGELKEMGRLSSCVPGLLNHAVGILLAGLCLSVVLAGWGVVRHGTIFGDSGFPEFLVLLVGLTILTFVWPARHFDATEFTRQLHKRLATGFASEGNLSGAELHFREALWLQPDDPEAFAGLANAILHDPNREQNQARAEAVSDYKAALRLKPGSPEIKDRLRALGVPVVE